MLIVLREMKKILISILLLVCGWYIEPLLAGNRSYRYRVTLTDKDSTVYSLLRPEEFLSKQALDRRIRQGLCVDTTDLPVCEKYLSKLKCAGVAVVGTSRWNNTVLVETKDTIRIKEIESLPFVKKVLKVWTKPDSIPARNRKRTNMLRPCSKKYQSYYGAAQNQVEMLNVDKLHHAGFRGKGIRIAVIDGGFLNADIIPLLQNVKIEGVKNFVHPGWDVYAELAHGMSVLSCMGADTPYVFVGTAPDASYWLFCSEDPDSESLMEEDLWAQAVEYADSIGIDIINTSLGYHAFDDADKNYHYCDLNGYNSFMSATASMAAEKGMVVVCSAGNSGNKVWKKITPPADAYNVLTVGAVDGNRINTVFSSVGYTADGRVKPDVMARGGAAAVIRPNGNVENANGTSYSSPILCGAVACLWQACPQLTAKEIIEKVRWVGHQFECPDNIYGYGIPDMWKAYLYSK